MIRISRKIWWLLMLAIIVEIMTAGCSERVKDPVILPDSTIVYPSKKPEGISPVITFSSKLSQKTGKQSAIGTVFALKEEADVYAVIELGNPPPGGKDLMFHIDWMDQEGRSVYFKRIDLAAGDSTSAIISSISVSPEKRPPGDYLVRVYLFRELIAEKHFELRPEAEMGKPSAAIIFYKSMDKETGEMKGIDTIFEIRKKGILRAQIDLINPGIYMDDELPFRLEWTGPDGKDFYSKKIDLLKADSISVINSSISITPDKREPGEYLLKIYLFDDVIGEKKFVLQAIQ